MQNPAGEAEEKHINDRQLCQILEPGSKLHMPQSCFACRAAPWLPRLPRLPLSDAAQMILIHLIFVFVNGWNQWVRRGSRLWAGVAWLQGRSVARWGVAAPPHLGCQSGGLRKLLPATHNFPLSTLPGGWMAGVRWGWALCLADVAISRQRRRFYTVKNYVGQREFIYVKINQRVNQRTNLLTGFSLFHGSDYNKNFLKRKIWGLLSCSRIKPPVSSLVSPSRKGIYIS